MKIMVSFVLAVIILSSLSSAYTVINFYIQENGEVDIIGNSDEDVALGIVGISYNSEKIFGTTQQLTNKKGDIWSLNFSMDSQADLKFYLPDSSSIEKIKASDSAISVENGQIIISQSSDKPEIYFEYKIGNNNFNYWIILLIAGGLIAALLIAIYLRFLIEKKSSEEKQNKIDKMKMIQDILNEREKMIINKLKEYKKNNIKIKSNLLRKATEIPKASFSRHIRQLEKKKLIKRYGEGRNKFVELS